MLHDCLQVEEWNCQRGGEDLGLWLLQAQRILCKQTGFLGWVESKEPAWNFLEPSGKLPAVGFISMDIEAVGFESLGTHTKITSVHCCNSSTFPGGFILGGCGLGMGITGLLQKNGLLEENPSPTFAIPTQNGFIPFKSKFGIGYEAFI